jgi:hypothetical protein
MSNRARCRLCRLTNTTRVHRLTQRYRRWQVLWSDDKTTRLDQSEMHKFCNLRVDGSISTAVLQVEDAQDAADAVQGDD